MSLVNGRSIVVPRYDFTTGKRSGNSGTLVLEEDRLSIIFWLGKYGVGMPIEHRLQCTAHLHRMHRRIGIAHGALPLRGPVADRSLYFGKPCRMAQRPGSAAAVKASTALSASASAESSSRSPRRASGARDQGDIGINHNPVAACRDNRGIAEAQREIQRFAEQHNQVCLREHFGKCAQAGVVDAARTFHADHRSAQRVLQLRGQRASARSAKPRRSKQQGPPGLVHFSHKLAGGCAEQIHGCGQIVWRGGRRVQIAFGHHLLKQIGGQADMHGTRTSRACKPESAGQIFAQSGSRVRGP